MGKKRTGELWTNAEEAALRKLYTAGVEVSDIAAVIKRHTEDGIRSHAYYIGLERPEDYVQPHRSENWERIEKAIRANGEGMTADEISAKTGICTSAIYKLLNHRRGRIVYVCEWMPRLRKPAAVWALGARPDAARPLTHRQKRKPVNPFAAAAGLVRPPAGGTGRIYAQQMDVCDEVTA
jgi:hypothetical protein